MSQQFQELQQFLNNQMAIMFEQDGYSPLVGRIFSLLLFAPEPIGLQEMADQLGVTKAAVSVQVRTLEKCGLCFKLARNSDRKDYYYIADEFSLTVVQTAMQKMKIVLVGIEETLRRFPHEEQIDAGEVPSYKAGKRRFREMQALYQAMFDRLGGLEETWKNKRMQMEQDGQFS